MSKFSVPVEFGAKLPLELSGSCTEPTASIPTLEVAESRKTTEPEPLEFGLSSTVAVVLEWLEIPPFIRVISTAGDDPLRPSAGFRVLIAICPLLAVSLHF